MIDLFKTLIFLSTGFSMGFTSIYCVGMFFSNKPGFSPSSYNDSSSLIKSCDVLSVIFVIFYWIVASTLDNKKCLIEYAEIAEISHKIGFWWILFSLGCILIGVFSCLTNNKRVLYNSEKKENDVNNRTTPLDVLTSMRTKGFVLGAIYLVISFVLEVK